MSDQVLDELLHEVSARTLEELGMLFLVSPEESPSAGARRHVQVGFTGPFSGQLTIAADAGLLRQLSGNMLGLDDGQEPSPEEADDALRELSNVLCGNLLPAVAGTGPVFVIGTPAILSTDWAGPDEAKPSSAVELWTDAGRLTVAVFADQLRTARA